MARPSFKPTQAIRNKVAIAAGGGMAHEEIALALGIARNTLEKYFQTELSFGAHQKRMEVMMAMHRAAKKGSVAAAKLYTQLSVRGVAPSEPAEKTPEGKKAQAQADAVSADYGTEWESLLRPTASIQ